MARPSPSWLLALALLPAAARAQSGSPSGAQTVSLQIRPRVGDTLHVRMDQEVEMTGTTRMGGADSTVRVVNALHVVSRAIVERSDPTGTTILTTTDSVALTSTATPPAQLEEARHALQGQQLHLRMAPDGATALVDSEGVRDDLRELFAQAPATLPREPVAVGDKWSREMSLPSPDGRPGGVLKAVFRLDSLTRRGEVAWVSMRGSITRDTTEGPQGGVKLATNGTVNGTLAVDRRRGWLVSSRTMIVVHSIMTPPPTRGEPLHFRMRITQWTRTAEK